MKKILSIFTLGIIATVALAQVDPNRVVAVVNGVEIKGAEYYRRMEYLPNVGKQLGDRFAVFPPGFMTIEQLITEKLIFQLAKQKGCLPSDQEVQADYERLKKESPAFIQQWTESGRLMEDLLNQLKFDLCQFKIVTNGIIVTDQDVESFYKNNPSTFTTPKRVQLRVIAVESDDDKAKVDKALSEGTKFEDVARTYSKDVTRAAGGEYGTVPLTDVAEVARKAIEATKIGQTTEWITAQDHRLKFLLENIFPEVLNPLDERMRLQVRRKLMLDKGVAKNDIGKLMSDLRKSAQIDIKQKDFAEAYKKFIAKYLEQEKAKQGSGN